MIDPWQADNRAGAERQARQAPKGRWPWQRGEMHPPEGVVLVYGDREVPVEVEWAGWEGRTRSQNFRVVLPEDLGEERPTALKADLWPGKTGLMFPALRGSE